MDLVDGQPIAISIHAPLTGSDERLWICGRRIRHFNPRSPYGERLHRLRFLAQPWMYFNPRSPYGERRSNSVIFRCPCQFQSTLPLRGATIGSGAISRRVVISIHAPLTGSDHHCFPPFSPPKYFNPRSPYGERPANNLSIPPI